LNRRNVLITATHASHRHFQGQPLCKVEVGGEMANPTKLKSAIVVNVAAVSGVLIGFRQSSQALSAEATARIAVFLLAFVNLLFFVIRPRIRSMSAGDGIRPHPLTESWRVFSERPIVTALVSVQVWAVARVLGSIILMIRSYNSEYVRSLPNIQSVRSRLILVSVCLAAVGVLWLLSAIGLWQTRNWAWWLALCLNGLASLTTILLQLLKHDQFLIDVLATGAVILLLSSPTRKIFKGSGVVVAAPELS
jgi:uncharacterized membrane protein (DUF2068 family)